MSDVYYAVPWRVQKAEIEAHCFGSCKKVYFGVLDDELLGALSTCGEKNCPFLKAQMDEPLGEVNGKLVYVRALLPVTETVTDAPRAP